MICHLRVINRKGGFSLAEDEEPVPSLVELLHLKMNQTIKSRLAQLDESLSQQDKLLINTRDTASSSATSW